jgi:hypothetical protein
VRKPEGSCAKWSDSQVAKWIKYLVSKGRFAFDSSGHAEDRAERRQVSNDEMVECVKRGLLVRREQHQVSRPEGGFVEERGTFAYSFASRPREIGNCVACISDSYNDSVILTFFWKKKK